MIRAAGIDDLAAWAELRARLWPAATADEHGRGITRAIGFAETERVVFFPKEIR